MRALAAKPDLGRICTSLPILWFDGGRAALAANTLDHSRAERVWGGKTVIPENVTKGVEEIFIPSWVVRADDGDGERF